jgi:hypothetical protein
MLRDRPLAPLQAIPIALARPVAALRHPDANHTRQSGRQDGGSSSPRRHRRAGLFPRLDYASKAGIQDVMLRTLSRTPACGGVTIPHEMCACDIRGFTQLGTSGANQTDVSCILFLVVPAKELSGNPADGRAKGAQRWDVRNWITASESGGPGLRALSGLPPVQARASSGCPLSRA